MIFYEKKFRKLLSDFFYYELLRFQRIDYERIGVIFEQIFIKITQNFEISFEKNVSSENPKIEKKLEIII